jgi:hypothetical protein
VRRTPSSTLANTFQGVSRGPGGCTIPGCGILHLFFSIIFFLLHRFISLPFLSHLMSIHIMCHMTTTSRPFRLCVLLHNLPSLNCVKQYALRFLSPRSWCTVRLFLYSIRLLVLYASSPLCFLFSRLSILKYCCLI